MNLLRHPARYLLAALLAVAPVVSPLLKADGLKVEPTPFSALIDFTPLQRVDSEPPASLPIWLESLRLIREEPGTLADLPSAPALRPESNPDAPFSVASSQPPPPTHSTYRLRLRSLPGLGEQLLLRLYFEDKPGYSPVVTGWNEIGRPLYASSPLGSELDLPNTASLSIPTNGVDYLDITVPGDGSTIRKAFLSTLQASTVHTALDFSHSEATTVRDPFGNSAEIPAPEEIAEEEPDDRLLYGRVHASLDSGEIRITPNDDGRSPTLYDIVFTLEGSPLLASVAFDLLNADPTLPLTATINGRPIGPIATRFPDLSDPAFSGRSRAFEGFSFHYTAWAPSQKMIPGRLLQPGQNRFTLELPPGSPPVAIRQIHIQLKHHWKKLDYTLIPH